MRELVHKVQNLRREKGFEIEEGVRVASRGARASRLCSGDGGATTSERRCSRGSSTSRRRPGRREP